MISVQKFDETKTRPKTSIAKFDLLRLFRSEAKREPPRKLLVSDQLCAIACNGECHVSLMLDSPYLWSVHWCSSCDRVWTGFSSWCSRSPCHCLPPRKLPIQNLEAWCSPAKRKPSFQTWWLIWNHVRPGAANWKFINVDFPGRKTKVCQV